MRNRLQPLGLVLARTAGVSTPNRSSTALVRSFISCPGAAAIRNQVTSYSPNPNLTLSLPTRPFSMSSSASQAPLDEAQPGDYQTGQSETMDASAAGSQSDVTAGSSSATKPELELPPLSPQEFRAYNRLAEHMEYFHDHFRKSWDLLYTAASSGKRPGGMTLKKFIDEGISLVRYLETHHGIEESYFFPILARRMPEFRPGKGKGAAELLRQHKEIHAGMEVFEDYLRKCLNRETELELGVLKEKMDSWGPVLLLHLDQEVETLGAENMRRYWTIDEIKTIPI